MPCSVFRKPRCGSACPLGAEATAEPGSEALQCPLFPLDLRLGSGERGTSFNFWLLYWENEFPKDWFFSSLKISSCLFWARWPFLTMIAVTKERVFAALLYLWDLSRAWFQSTFTYLQRNGHTPLFKLQHIRVLGLLGKLDNAIPSADSNTQWGSDTHGAPFPWQSVSGQSKYEHWRPRNNIFPLS